jgi:hypothetical protein
MQFSKLVVLALLGGCGGHATPASTPAASSVALADPTNESIGGVKTGDPSALVEKKLGAPTTKSEPQTMEATGETVSSWQWPAAGVSMTMASTEAGFVVRDISIVAPSKLTTSRGVGIGASRADVEKIYKDFLGKGRQEGEPDTTSPEQLIIGSIYGGTAFSFTDGKVSTIFVGAGAE